MKKAQFVLALLGTMLFASASQAAYLIEVDTDGLDDGVLTFSPDFSFGAGTTSASQSSSSPAFGLTGGDSIFAADAVAPDLDTYVFTYSPDSQADNLVIPQATPLGEGNRGSGVVGGGADVYSVYMTWPETTNVSGGFTNYSVVTAGDSFTTFLNQNDVNLLGSAGRGGGWVKLGEINYTSGSITVTQTPTSNSFVSMRAAGALFEPIPEPASLGLVTLAGLVMALRRKQRS